MLKKFLPIFISFILLFSTSSLVAAANNPQDAIAQSKLKFQQMNESIIETNKKMADLNIKVDKLSKDISKNNEDINKNNKLIEDEKISLQKLTDQVNSNQQVANKRLRTLYINGYDESFFNVMLESKGFSDFLNKFDAIRKIVSFDKKIFDDLSERKSCLVNVSMI